MKLPTIIKNILIETYLDFENINTDGDVSKINLKIRCSTLYYFLYFVFSARSMA